MAHVVYLRQAFGVGRVSESAAGGEKAPHLAAAVVTDRFGGVRYGLVCSLMFDPLPPPDPGDSSRCSVTLVYLNSSVHRNIQSACHS